MLSYTDFELSLGIRDQKRDPEYVDLLKSTIAELYTLYGICLSRDVSSNSETLNITSFGTFSLLYKNISNVSIVGKTYNTDFIYDSVLGTITILDSGNYSLPESLVISYNYTIFQNVSDVFTYLFYPSQSETLYNIVASPINRINSVYHNNVKLEEVVDYYFYDGKFELIYSNIDFRKPIILSLDVGFVNIPFDLKSAFYEYVQYKFDFRDKKAGLFTEIKTSADSSVKILPRVPQHLLNIFKAYSAKSLVR